MLDRERPRLVKVDATYGSVAQSVALPAGRGGGGVDIGRGGVWVAAGTNRLLKLDPHDATVVKRFDLQQVFR